MEKAYNIEVTRVEEDTGYYHIYEATVTLNEGANGYRLPTEAEWEYAARGGNPTAKDWNYTFSGANKAEGTHYSDEKNAGLDAVGWYRYNTETGKTGETEPTWGSQGFGTHQVGKKAANSLDIYDMSGNVNEWCYDRNSDTITSETPPLGPSSGDARVYRGGDWSDYSCDTFVFCRNRLFPSTGDSTIGFRVVRPSSK